MKETNDTETQLENKAKEYFGKDFISDFENLKKQLRDEKTILRIHGTNLKSAQSILKEGLRFWMPTVKGTSYEAYRYQDLKDWKHKSSEYLVLLGIPIEATTEGALSENLEEAKPILKLDEERPSDSNYHSNYILPSEFIIGYIDVKSKSIIRNPKYKTEHNYEDLYVVDSELGAKKDVNFSLFGDEEDLREIDEDVTPVERDEGLTQTKSLTKQFERNEELKLTKEEEKMFEGVELDDGW